MKKILVVDDDAWLAESYRLVLESAGWQVSLANSGGQAINVIDDTQPHVVLLDLMLPESSAPALLNELQSHSDLASLPIIICSSLSVGEHTQSHLQHYGVKQIIDKTKITPEELIATIESVRHANN